MDMYLVGKGWVYQPYTFFAFVEVVIFIAKMRGKPTDLNVEPGDFFVGTLELEVSVHGKASSGCCPWAVLNLLASIAK
jgi:hypothetical protein